MKFKPYPKYKESGIEWLEEIPEHWEIKRLRFVADYKNSNVDKKSYEDQSKVRLCNYTDVYYNEFIKNDMDFMVATASKSEIETMSLLIGDVIMTKDSEDPSDIGIPTIVAEELDNVVCGYHLTIISSGKVGTNRFIHRVIQSDISKFYFKVMSPGMTRYGLNQNSIGNTIIPLPNLSEQKAIANFLDRETIRIDSLIKEKEKFISLLKEKHLVLINHVITKGLDSTAKMKDSGADWIGKVPEHWAIKKVKHLFEIRKRISGEEGYPVLSITQQGIKVKDTVSGKGQLSMDYAKYQFVEVGDFAMNHMDLLTGYVDLSKFHGVTSPDYRFFSLIDPETVDRYYLYLMQIGYKNKIFFGLGQGVANNGRWRLQTDSFNNFNIPYPDKTEQQKIVDYLDNQVIKINGLIKETQNSIELLKEHRTALISAAVTGKIDVRNKEVA
ncbi:type I restriction enzyme, S subunit [Bathymodiolus platifrons methanotrophic gill symbiont]|uniref:restriction endonuclease subunit S n=1 Tax=Bathymodiolus platifrons methanotrophic gill symbiont TaxID=113268 RepID=UPI000B42241E|nr:restriction endonuclease subunit S [Bathymodiolus platifrons methanotrophic gill symbiont]GAW86871.1 type I restriction enzyme, S subunit [Bathymodiolus platifrons methanotrophic gill symbiont]